jgi:hypothetical protein
MSIVGQKYLLCRPRGGLNDSLCQIQKCFDYAQKYSRVLIIDAKDSGLMGEFSDFFSPVSEEVKVYGSRVEFDYSNLLECSCYPDVMFDGSGRYKIAFSALQHHQNYIDVSSGTLLTFDFNRDYEELVLIHEQCGGGTMSFGFLGKFRLADAVLAIAKIRLKDLQGDYLSIHVRNTEEYLTNYQYFFNKIFSKVAHKKLLVCSDDPSVVAYAKEFFIHTEIISVSNIRSVGNKPLHFHSTYENDDEKRDATINSLMDCVALAGASKFFYMNPAHGHPSGFAVLTAHLCNNRRNLFPSFLPGLDIGSGVGRAVHLFPTSEKVRKFFPKPLRPIYDLLLSVFNK